MLTTAFSLSRALTVIPLAALSDRYGRKRALLVSLVLIGLSTFAWTFTAEYSLLLLANIVWGIAGGLYGASHGPLLAESVLASKRTAAFGLGSFVWWTANSLGAALAAFPEVLRNQLNFELTASYQLMYALAGTTVLIGFLPTILVGESRFSGVTFSLIPRKSLAVIAKYWVTKATMWVGLGLIGPLFSLWVFLKFSYTEIILGPLFATATVASAMGYLAVPRLADKIGLIRTTIFTIGLASVTILLMPNLGFLFALGTLFVLYRLLVRMSDPVLESF